MTPEVQARHEPSRDRAKTKALTELLGAVHSLDEAALGSLAQACADTRPARAAAAAVLTDTLKSAPGWQYADAAVRFPDAVRLLNSVTREETLAELSTTTRLALVDAMVAVVWRELADSIGSRLAGTLASPFQGFIGRSAPQ